MNDLQMDNESQNRKCDELKGTLISCEKRGIELGKKAQWKNGK